jgi:hypothetical protein
MQETQTWQRTESGKCDYQNLDPASPGYSASRATMADRKIFQYFSLQEQDRPKGTKIAAKPQLHKPVNEKCAEALEISLVALAGRKLDGLKLGAFVVVYIGIGVLLALFANWYSGSPKIELTGAPAAVGAIGFWLVIYGVLCLALVWLPGVLSSCTATDCPINVASRLLLYCEDGTKHHARVFARSGPDGKTVIRCFEFRHLRFTFNDESGDFEVRPATLSRDVACRSGRLPVPLYASARSGST